MASLSGLSGMHRSKASDHLSFKIFYHQQDVTEDLALRSFDLNTDYPPSLSAAEGADQTNLDKLSLGDPAFADTKHWELLSARDASPVKTVATIDDIMKENILSSISQTKV